MKLSYLVKGFPGHPLHPPLTDATIGIYTASTIFAVLSVLGVAEGNMAKGWWLTLIFGLIVTGATAFTGLIDWLTITWRSELWWTATWHMLSMLSATLFFGLAALFGHDDYVNGDVSGGSLMLTLLGFGLLTLGGWLGGSVVFVHGMRVLSLPEEPTERAVTPGGAEKEMAEGS
jgi:uncharacterized membrane protein